MSNVSDGKKVGRPATGIGIPVTVRLSEDQLASLDAFRLTQADIPTRPEALRRLMGLGLTQAGVD